MTTAQSGRLAHASVATVGESAKALSSTAPVNVASAVIEKHASMSKSGGASGGCGGCEGGAGGAPTTKKSTCGCAAACALGLSSSRRHSWYVPAGGATVMDASAFTNPPSSGGMGGWMHAMPTGDR